MNRNPSSFRRHALATAVVLALAGGVQAQLSTATIKGQITSGEAAAQGGLAVVAVNQANGNTYRTTTLADGSYVLPGLAPGSYEIRVSSPGGAVNTQVITVQVGQTAAVDLTLGGSVQRLESVTVIGNAQRRDVRTPEVGTHVSRKMIENLPQVTRNFLSSADLAPGVAFTTDNNSNTNIQAGAQNFDHVNVFIDGVGQKNNILRGGLTGQDNSRGNPFPQSAIAEYKVLTQNYKAEFDQVSSAAITAITKSGGNEFHGDAYVDRTGTNWRARSVFEKEKEAQGVPLPPSTKNEYGFSVGGPIKRDQVHFFVAYDGKNIEDSRQVVPRNLDKLPAGQGIVPTLAGVRGSQVDPFREHLLFGKIDAQLNEEQKLSVSARVRRESDRRPEDRELSSPGNDKDRTNDETRVDIRHEWARGAWLSEARLGYEEFAWNPRSASSLPFVKYKVSTATPQMREGALDVLFTGGSPDAQYRAQKGLALSEDLTYTGLKGHVLKGGVRIKAMKYDLSGTARSLDIVETLIDTTTGLPYFDGSNCTGTNVEQGGDKSNECLIRRAEPATAVMLKNNQIGLYFQDDWAVTKQLELNLGVRYDYETNMLNNDYVTPADRVAALFAPDVPRQGITPAPGQTYAESLAKGGINISDYIATGNSRKPFKGAVAPRLGASFDLFADRNSVLFGGWGRSYDRTIANHALDELQKNNIPGQGEVWLIRNDIKMPYADQVSFGLRQALGTWNTEITLSQIHAKNQFQWFAGDRDPNGGFGPRAGSIDPMWGAGPPGLGMLVLGDFVGESRTNSLFVKAEKPYTESSGWGVNVAYTYSDAKTTHRDWNNDIFDWTYGKPRAQEWNPSRLVDKHRVVAAGVVDKLLPWGMTLGVKATWASGMPLRSVGCPVSWDECVAIPVDTPSFRQVDVSVSKATKLLGNTLTVRADVLNVFNTVNYGSFVDWRGGVGEPLNPELGKPNGIRGDTRTFRLMVAYRF